MSALTERLREPLCDEWFRARLLRQGLSLYETAMYVKAVEAERGEAAAALEAAEKERDEALEWSYPKLAALNGVLKERYEAAEARAAAATALIAEFFEQFDQPEVGLFAPTDDLEDRMRAAVGARQEPPPATPIARVEGDWVAAEARQKPPPAAVLDPVDVAYPGLTADSAAVPPEAT